jgi:hypothetical protein
MSHWTPFDPYSSARRNRRHASHVRRTVYQLPHGEIEILEYPLHSAFFQPATPFDIYKTLAILPADCIAGLESIFLHGGSNKQESIRDSAVFRFGDYSSNVIMLYPFPRQWLNTPLSRHENRHLWHDLRRAGANMSGGDRSEICHFTPENVRRFYLADVLVHEVGHHVDRVRLQRKSTSRAERFAEAFVDRYGRAVASFWMH